MIKDENFFQLPDKTWVNQEGKTLSNITECQKSGGGGKVCFAWKRNHAYREWRKDTITRKESTLWSPYLFHFILNFKKNVTLCDQRTWVFLGTEHLGYAHISSPIRYPGNTVHWYKKSKSRTLKSGHLRVGFCVGKERLRCRMVILEFGP